MHFPPHSDPGHSLAADTRVCSDTPPETSTSSPLEQTGKCRTEANPAGAQCGVRRSAPNSACHCCPLWRSTFTCVSCHITFSEVHDEPRRISIQASKLSGRVPQKRMNFRPDITRLPVAGSCAMRRQGHFRNSLTLVLNSINRDPRLGGTRRPHSSQASVEAAIFERALVLLSTDPPRSGALRGTVVGNTPQALHEFEDHLRHE